MAKHDLINDVSHATGIIRTDVNMIVTKFLDLLRDRVSRGESIALKEFGTFKARRRPQKIARNLKGRINGRRKNPEPIILPETTVPHFKPSKNFLKHGIHTQ